MWQDTVNGLFELFGVFLILGHVRVLYIHKRVAGVSILSMIGFTMWSYWNLYYYPQLGQTFSTYSAYCMVIVQNIYTITLIYYVRNPGGKSGKIREI